VLLLLAEKKGFQSKTRKNAQANFDNKSADYDTKSDEYDAASDSVDTSKRFRKLAPVKKGKGKGVGYQYAPVVAPGTGWSTNPDYTTQVTAQDAAETAMDSAETAKDSASTTLDTKKAADLEKTKTPKSQKVQTGGGKAGKKGKKKN